jgi:hypothetical protein
VTQDCALAAGEHRRHRPPLLADRAVACRVNTAVKGVEPAIAEHAVDRPRRYARRNELRPAHDAVLPHSDPRDRGRRG